MQTHELEIEFFFFFSPWKLLKAVLNSRFRANKLPHQVYCHVQSDGWNATESNDFHLCLNERTVFGRLKASLKIRKKERIKKQMRDRWRWIVLADPPGLGDGRRPKICTHWKRKKIYFFSGQYENKKEKKNGLKKSTKDAVSSAIRRSDLGNETDGCLNNLYASSSGAVKGIKGYWLPSRPCRWIFSFLISIKNRPPGSALH